MKHSFKRTIAILLTMLMLLSTVLVGTATTASAATMVPGSKIYLKPSSSWQVDGARFAVYFWNGSGEISWYSMIPSSQGAGVYEAVVPNGTWDNLIFARMNGGTTDNNWDNKWNQTNDLTWDGTNNCYVTNENSWDGDIGYWTKLDDGGNNTQPTIQPPTKPSTAPTTEPTTEPTHPVADDEDQFLYVSARSNLNIEGIKTKTTGNLITVTYSLKAAELIDGGQANIFYDANKLKLSTVYNTVDTMFPNLKGVACNLHADTGVAMFNFANLNNDFTSGADFVNLVFERNNNAVGTAAVRLDVVDLTSKLTTYVEDAVINEKATINVTPTVTEVEYTVPTTGPVETDATQDLTVRVSSNISEDITDIKVDKLNVKVTFNLDVAELIAFGNGTVTFDENCLALEDRFNTDSTIFTTITSGGTYNLNAATGTMKFAFTGVDGNKKKGIYDFAGGKELITLVFTVKSGAKGVAHVRLNIENLGSVNKDYITDFAVEDLVSGTVNGEAQQATASATDPTKPPIATGGNTDPSATDPSESDSVPTVPSSSETDPSESNDPSNPSDPSNPTTPTETDPVEKPTKPADSVGKGNSIEQVDEFIKDLDNDDDPKGSNFGSLQAKAAKISKKSIKLAWTKVDGAKKYVIYGNKCGSDYKKLKTITKLAYTQKKLKKNTYYKYLVVAVDKNDNVITTSATIHAATAGGKNGNPTAIKTAAVKDTVKIKVNKKFNLKAKVKDPANVVVKKHRVVKYETSNSKIATVTNKGVIKAKKKGSCYVYAYAQNGVAKRIKVKVN